MDLLNSKQHLTFSVLAALWNESLGYVTMNLSITCTRKILLILHRV